jgi:ubiquinone/menaquinone biosynthesis C-methylase UbiE
MSPELLTIKILKTVGLEPAMKVGDFGCGWRGTFTFAAAQVVGEAGRVYAVDILKPVLKTINDQARLEGFEGIVETVWSNLEKYQATDIKDNFLDIGLLINVLFQTNRPVEVIKEAARMIAPGGKLFLSDWLNNSQLAKTEIKHSLKKPVEVKQIADGLGLKLIKEFKPWESHFGLVFEK